MTSEQFKSHRQSLGFTQKEIAKNLCVSYWTVVKWENGGEIPLCCQKLFCLMYDISFRPPSRGLPYDLHDSPDLPFE